MRLALAATLLTACLGTRAAAVCDPDLGCGPGRSTPTATPVATLNVEAQVERLGLHRVEEVWAGDVVRTQGSVTTYTTSTDLQDAGTYARRVASVATGETSAYDGVVFNGRRSLSTGQGVAGDVYASYVLRGGELVLDRYVFFQDDSEAQAARSASPTPVAGVAPAPSNTPAPAPAASPPQPSSAPPIPSAPRPTPRSSEVAAGLALERQGDMLDRIEVLRGRAVELWPRATVDGAPARVVAWRLVSGEVTALGPVSGSGDQPLVATWRSLALRGSPFEVRLAVDVAVSGRTVRGVNASLEIVVRSPALIE